MRKGTIGRSPHFRVAVGAVLAIGAGMLAACARSGPPAPVIDRTGAYTGRTVAAEPPPPASTAAATKAPGKVTKAPLRREVSAVPLGPVRPVTAGPASSPPLRARPAPARTANAVAQPARRGIVTARRAGTVRVRRGDTLFRIARREKIPIRALIDENRLRPPYRLRAGQRLRIPSLRVYVVAAGDTVHAISRRFDVSTGAIIHDNGLKAPRFGVFTGQRLVLPWRPPPPRPAKLAAHPRKAAPAAAPQRYVSSQPTLRATKVAVRSARATRPPPRARSKFLWPVHGKVVSGFGAKSNGLYNDGINIAARSGAIVRAAENGVVAYSGNELRGYGNLLLLRHADGWISAYAHNGELLVRRGEVVRRGQPIARVGRSGTVTSPQLHFELRRGHKAVDPRRHLG